MDEPGDTGAPQVAGDAAPGSVTVTTTPSETPPAGGADAAAVAMAAVAGAAAQASEAATATVAELEQDVENAEQALQEFETWKTQTRDTLTTLEQRTVAQAEAITHLSTMAQTMSEALARVLLILQPQSPQSGADGHQGHETGSAAQTSLPNPEAEAQTQPPPEKPHAQKRRWM